MSTKIGDPFAWRDRLRELSEKAFAGGDDAALEALCREGVPGYDPWRDAEGFTFDHARARRWCEFFPEMLRHVKGPRAKRPFDLEPWQQAIHANAFGWIDGAGLRRYRTVFLYVPKKNGKSAYIGGVVVQVLAIDGEEGAECYSVAAAKKQAAHVFDHASGMVRQNPELNSKAGGILRVYGAGRGGQLKQITYPDTDSRYECIASDEETADGSNVHFLAADELHRHKTAIVDVLEKSTAARSQPMVWKFTTADTARPSICNEELDLARKVRDGSYPRADYLPAIYEACEPGDAEDVDWENRETWYRANPNIGVSFPESFMANLVEEAKVKPGKLHSLMRLHLNVVMNADGVWLDMNSWNACGREDYGDLVKRLEASGSPCFGGIDGASKKDLFAFKLFFPEEKAELAWYWRPSVGVKDAADRDMAPYEEWAGQGWLTLTDGNVTDHARVRREIADICGRFNVIEVGYDPRDLTQFGVELQDDLGEGRVKEFKQTLATMSEPSKALEDEVAARDLEHGGHPVSSWCASNAQVVEDHQNRIYPSKKRSNGRIDGVTASVIARGMAIESDGATESVYEHRGVLRL